MLLNTKVKIVLFLYVICYFSCIEKKKVVLLFFVKIFKHSLPPNLVIKYSLEISAILLSKIFKSIFSLSYFGFLFIIILYFSPTKTCLGTFVCILSEIVI